MNNIKHSIVERQQRRRARFESIFEGKRLNRLACTFCDREDGDNLTDEQLKQCRADGWMVLDTPVFTHQPTDGDVGENYSHLGVCPQCRNYIAEKAKGAWS